MIDARIINGIEEKTFAEVTNEYHTDPNALKVATVEYHNYNPAVAFFTNESYGIDLNKNFSSTAGEQIHNGTDNAYWTATQDIGTSMIFDDDTNPDTGAKAIRIDGSTNGDVAFFDKGSDFTITNELALQGRVYITSYVDGKSDLKIRAWDSVGDIAVGKEKKIFDYVNDSLWGEYQTFNIPIADLELLDATFDQLRLKVDKDDVYADLDNIQFTTAGAALGTQVFNIKPNLGSQLIVNGFNITMADNITGAVENGTLPAIRYDGFLGLATLESGLLFRTVNNLDNITFVAQIRELIEFFQFGHSTFGGMGSDGTNTWFHLHLLLSSPIVLNDDEKDKLELVLSDNLSGLEWFRWSIDGKQRTIF